MMGVSAIDVGTRPPASLVVISPFTSRRVQNTPSPRAGIVFLYLCASNGHDAVIEQRI
jgi:hypothetical protein